MQSHCKHPFIDLSQNKIFLLSADSPTNHYGTQHALMQILSKQKKKFSKNGTNPENIKLKK